MVCSGVYTPAQNNDKDKFWDHPIHLHSVIDTHWVSIGDFDESACPNDKKGLQVLPNGRYQRLDNFFLFFFTIDVESISINGKPFTSKTEFIPILFIKRIAS